jgi:hypothetical protein
MQRRVDKEVVISSFALALLGIVMAAGRYWRWRTH